MVEQQLTPAVSPELQKNRERIDWMNGRIVTRLLDRAQFNQNLEVYEPGAVYIEGAPDLSMVEFAIDGIEGYHALLGRFDYPDQFPIRGNNLPQSRVKRPHDNDPMSQIPIPIDDLLPFYKDVINRYYKPGSKMDQFGETSFVDADVLELIHERINVGRDVAKSKAKEDPTLVDMSADTDYVLPRIKNKAREDKTVNDVKEIAQHYGVNETMVEEVFRWIIEKTIYVEMEYFKKLKELKDGEALNLSS